LNSPGSAVVAGAESRTNVRELQPPVLHSPAPVPAFEAKGATRVFHGRNGRVARAVDGVTLKFVQAEPAALIGPSGAGKTTLLRLLAGAIAATEGDVLFEGQSWRSRDGASLREARSRIGFIAQRHNLVDRLAVWQNVLAGRFGHMGTLGAARMFVWPAQRELDQAADALARVGIAELLHSRTDELSGGQTQRVAIARALVQRPIALLGDEPVASLDPEMGSAVLALLRDLARTEGAALILSLHDVRLARAHFPRLVGLRAGSVQFDLPTALVTDDMLRDLYSVETA